MKIGSVWRNILLTHSPIVLELLYNDIFCLDFKLMYCLSTMFIAELFDFIGGYCFTKSDVCFVNECLNWLALQKKKLILHFISMLKIKIYAQRQRTRYLFSCFRMISYSVLYIPVRYTVNDCIASPSSRLDNNFSWFHSNIFSAIINITLAPS